MLIAGLLLSTISPKATVVVLSAVMLALALAAAISPAVRHAPDLTPERGTGMAETRW